LTISNHELLKKTDKFFSFKDRTTTASNYDPVNDYVFTEGEKFELIGKVESEVSNITDVTIKLINKDDDSEVFTKSVKPNSTTYDIGANKDAFSDFKFEDLKTNTKGYEYTIEATNGTGTKKTKAEVFSVWKKLVNGNFGSSSTREEVGKCFDGNHMFYYKLNGTNVNRGIDIHPKDEYLDYIPGEQNVTLPSGTKAKVPTTVKDKFQNALDRTKEVKLTINVKYKEEGIDKESVISEILLSSLVSNFDGAWVHRFQTGNQYISVHTYGLAMDINTGYDVNKQDSKNKKKIDDAVELLSDGTVTTKDNVKTYTFTYSADEKIESIPQELANFFLHHLAFKDFGFYWGGYFTNTDAMHFSLVEKVSIPKEHSEKIP